MIIWQLSSHGPLSCVCPVSKACRSAHNRRGEINLSPSVLYTVLVLSQTHQHNFPLLSFLSHPYLFSFPPLLSNFLFSLYPVYLFCIHIFIFSCSLLHLTLFSVLPFCHFIVLPLCNLFSNGLLSFAILFPCTLSLYFSFSATFDHIYFCIPFSVPPNFLRIGTLISFLSF